MNDYKCILSLNLARYLLAQGFSITDVETSKKVPGKIVFIFRNSPQLHAAIRNYQKHKGELIASGTTEQRQPKGNYSQTQ